MRQTQKHKEEAEEARMLMFKPDQEALDAELESMFPSDGAAVLQMRQTQKHKEEAEEAAYQNMRQTQKHKEEAEEAAYQNVDGQT
ncbi:hypothetical protein T484DRAFT_1820535 [Baffinella frigidus]|nr:hypothetical protein T484DRAFT_1820535 [Cryptophyta sp. CCMP2293]